MGATPVVPDWGENEDPEDGYVDDVPLSEQPVQSQLWVCTGVKVRTLAKKADEPHTMPAGSEPDQPTTDSSGKWRSGKCADCGTNTIWKEMRL